LETVTAQLSSMQSATVFGQTIRYYDVGSGPVLILLHGLANTALATWGRVIEALAATHRVVAMDQIGFGASDKPSIEFRIQTYVDFLGEFLRLQKIERFILAGVSLGGWIAAQYAIQALQSDKPVAPASKLPIPSKLLLCGAVGLRMQAPHQEILISSLPDSVATMKEALKNVFYDESMIDDQVARMAFMSRLAANDGLTVRSLVSSFPTCTEWLNDKLHHITTPTLVVWGDEDRIVPLTFGRDLAAQIPNAKLAIIERCGHAPMIERPDDFLGAIKDFL
jgi:pimeloyl-ACP methyl ester carboxylesterase